MKHPFSLYALAVMMTAIGAWCAAWWVIPAAIAAAASAPYVLAAVAMVMAVTAIPLAVRDGGIDDEFDAAITSKRWAHHVEYVDGHPFLVGDDWERPATPEFRPFQAFEPPPYTPEALQQVLGYESWGAPEHLPDPSYTQVMAQDLPWQDEEDWELISQWAEAPTIHAPAPEAPALDWSMLEESVDSESQARIRDLELEIETLRMGTDTLHSRLRERDQEVKDLKDKIRRQHLYLMTIQQELEEQKTFSEFHMARTRRAEALLKEVSQTPPTVEGALKHLDRALDASKNSEAMTAQEEYEQAAGRG